MSTDFLIVGGGIGGAVLAHLLGTAGKRVVVLERETAASKPLPRPEVLWPATIRILRPLLPRETADATLLPVKGVTFVRGRRKVSFEMASGGRSQPAAGACFTDPALTRRRLTESGPFELRRGVTVTEVLRDRGRVVGVRARETAGPGVGDGKEFDLLAEWTVGDDGARSVVRRECGIDLEPESLPLELLCFGCEWPGELPEAIGRLWAGEASNESDVFLAGLGPLPGGRAAGLVPVRSEALKDPHKLSEDWRRFCHRNPVPPAVASQNFPDGMIRVRPVFGNASRYGTDGAVLIGDAAHPVTPAGGQGANLSVADAKALADTVLASPSDFIAEYERRRRPAAERSLQLSRRAVRVLKLPDPILRRLFLAALGFAGLRPQLFAPLLRASATAFQGEPPQPRRRTKWAYA